MHSTLCTVKSVQVQYIVWCRVFIIQCSVLCRVSLVQSTVYCDRDRHGQYAEAGSRMKFSQLAVPGRRGGGSILGETDDNLYYKEPLFLEI